MARSQYSDEDRSWARLRFRNLSDPLDAIPYTKLFEELFKEFNTNQIAAWTRPDFWKLLLAVRKQGLGGARRSKTAAPTLSAKLQARLKDLMPRTRGEVDRLPYTSAFKTIYSAFSRYLSKPLQRQEVWLVCLHIAKQSIRKNARPLLEKAVRRIRAGINAFNRIGGENRLDDAVITMHHAMEMLLKAGLIQHDIAIMEKDSGHYMQFKPCLRNAVHHEKGKFLSPEDRQRLVALDAARGDAYHGLLELDETEAFVLFSSAVEIFQKTLWEVFWKDLADELGSLVLPISTVPLADSLVLLNRKHEQIQKLLKAGESARAMAATRSLAILEKATGGEEDARVSEQEVRAALERVNSEDSIAAVFPGIAGLPITQTDAGATIFIAVRRRGGGEVAEEVGSHQAVVAVEHRDFRDTHPFRFKELKERVGISQHKLHGVISELKVKEDPAYYHQHGPAKGQKTGGYSQAAVDQILKFIESYDGDLLDLYRKHCRSQYKPKQ